MMTSQDVERALWNYFAAVGEVTDRTFTINDFNSQVMMNAYSPEERAGLLPALERLVGGGCAIQASPIAYRLTSVGVRRVQALRLARKHAAPVAETAAPGR